MDTKNIKKEEKKLDNYGKIAKILFVLVLVVALFGISYAVFKTVAYGTKTNELTVGTVGLKIFDESSSGITLDNTVPVTEEEGIANTAYTFSLTNTGSYTMNYKLGFELADDTTMPASSVRYILTKDGVDGVSSILGTIVPEYIYDSTTDTNKIVYYLEAGQIASAATYDYALKIWIDYNASLESNGMKFSVRARADGEAVANTASPWTLENKQALRTPIDDQTATMYKHNLIEGAEYAYKLTDGDNPIQYYIGQNLGNVLIVPTANSYYVYAFTKNSYGIEIGKWYQTNADMQVFSTYEGTSPISKGNYTTIYNEDYFDQMIESFNF